MRNAVAVVRPRGSTHLRVPGEDAEAQDGGHPQRRERAPDERVQRGDGQAKVPVAALLQSQVQPLRVALPRPTEQRVASVTS